MKSSRKIAAGPASAATLRFAGRAVESVELGRGVAMVLGQPACGVIVQLEQFFAAAVQTRP